eukprot:732330-Amorphochlora_amoeboformis.AAC.4
MARASINDYRGLIYMALSALGQAFGALFVKFAAHRGMQCFQSKTTTRSFNSLVLFTSENVDSHSFDFQYCSSVE